METSIFKYGELPEFKKFTPESISKQFPEVLIKIGNDFNKLESSKAFFARVVEDSKEYFL